MKAGIILLALVAAVFAVTPNADLSSQPAETRLYYGLVGSNDYVVSPTTPDASTDAWSLHSNMPGALMDHAAAGNATHTYVVSGYRAGNPKDLFRHATGGTTWQTLAAPPIEVSNGGIAIIGDTLYYCTGYSYGLSPTRTLDTLMKYSISGNNWTIAPGPHGGGTTYNWQPFIVACAGKLYYISGCNQPGATSPTTQVWAYTPGTGWAARAALNQGRVFAAGWVYNDTIWMAGGYQNTTVLNHTEFYDPVANVWTVNNTRFPTMPVPAWGAGSGVTGGTGWVAGGVTPAGALQDTIMYFDHAAATWTIGSGLHTKVYRTAGCGSADGKAILYGGSTGGFTPITTCQYEALASGNANDVGATAVLAPGTPIPPGTYAPKVAVRNFGTAPQSNFPVTCWVDSGATRVYNQTANYTGTLAPGATDSLTLPNWTTGQSGTYNFKAFTNLTADENRANDTITKTVTVVSSTWTPITPIPDSADRVVHSVFYDKGGDKLYMVGGCAAGASGTYRGLNHVYDPVGNTWTNRAPMPTPLGWCGAGIVNGKIYMIGGHNNAGGFVATNQEYDIAANTWTTKLARPGTAVAAPLSATWRDSIIYIMGGLATSAESRVDVYNPATNTWATGTALPAGAYMGTATCIGDTIYIAQAYNTACWPNFYKGYINPANPTQITWTVGPVLAEPVFNGPTVALDNKVYWMGGFINAATVTNKVWTYDQATGTISAFQPVYPTTIARWTFAAARPAPGGGGEIYCFAGDRLGDWNAPNRDYNKINIVSTGVVEGPGWQPLEYSLGSVVPSLVVNNARVSYTLGQAANVNLSVYDASGTLVRTLVSGRSEAGTRSATWNRTSDSGSRVAAGTYFCRLTVDGASVSTKAVVLD